MTRVIASPLIRILTSDNSSMRQVQPSPHPPKAAAATRHLKTSAPHAGAYGTFHGPILMRPNGNVLFRLRAHVRRRVYAVAGLDRGRGTRPSGCGCLCGFFGFLSHSKEKESRYSRYSTACNGNPPTRTSLKCNMCGVWNPPTRTSLKCNMCGVWKQSYRAISAGKIKSLGSPDAEDKRPTTLWPSSGALALSYNALRTATPPGRAVSGRRTAAGRA